MRDLFRRLGQWARRDRAERDLVEEIEFHRAMRQARFEADGMRPDEAAAASRRALGNQTLAREDAREVWVAAWLASLLQDVRYALRSLRKQPGFTLTALAVLGPAIGLNTTLATLASSLLWQPWPVPEPATLVLMFKTSAMAPGQSGNRRDGDGSAEFQFSEYRSLADRAQLTTIFATNCGRELRMEACEVQVDDERTMAAFVSGNYFSALRVEMARGRAFRRDDDNMNRPAAVAILSHALWQRRFGGDPDIIGRDIGLDALPFTVIGITPAEFTGPTLLARDVWIPIAAGGLLRPGTRPAVWVELGGRLADGATRERAEAELQSIFQPANGRPSRMHLTGTSSFSRPNDRRELYSGFSVMLLGVLLVLLLACANVGNLLLARMLARGREIAVRASLGASRLRIVRQLLTEGLVLSIAASLLGLWIASFLPTFVFEQAAGEPHRLAFPVAPDAGVLGYACGLAAVTCLSFGLAPALYATRRDLVAARRDRGGPAGSRLRAVLLCTQIATSVVLLSAAGLLIRSLQHARAVERGFQVEDLSVITFDPPASHVPDRIGKFARALIDSLDGAAPVGAAAIMAPGPQNNTLRVTIDHAESKERRQVRVIEISANYFDVLGLPIVAGRALTGADAGRDVVVINEAMARQQWPLDAAPGRSFVTRSAAGLTDQMVVGIAKNADPTGDTRPGDDPSPVIYRLVGSGVALHGRRPGDAQWGLPELLVRGDLTTGLQALRARANALDSLVAVRAAPLTERFDRRLGEPRFLASIAGVLGGVALALAAVGVFGGFAFIVRQQTREIGIRIALGARSVQVVRGVLGIGARPLVAGVVLGLAGSLAGAQLLRSSLLGLSPLDPWAYVSVLAVLGVAAVAALGVPAWRATRVDPTIALRSE